MANEEIQHAREAAVLAERLFRLSEAVADLKDKSAKINDLFLTKMVFFDTCQKEIQNMRQELDDLEDHFNQERLAVERRVGEVDKRVGDTATQLKIYVAILAAIAALVGGILADAFKK